MSTLTRAIAHLLLFIILIQTTIWPARATAAVVDIHGVDRTWANHAAWSQNWVPQPMVLGRAVNAAQMPRVHVPKDNWSEIAVGQWDAQHGFDLSQMRVPEWAVNNNLNAGKYRKDGFDYSNRRIMWDRPYVQVWASYDPVNAKARIMVQKAELGLDNQVHVYVADWTPWHGRDWQKVLAYTTSSERLAPLDGGNSPFRLFQADTNTSILTTTNHAATRDPIWHNISFQGVQVALGLAMQHYQANFGLIYIPDTRFDQNQSCSSSFFKKKCTTTVTGLAKPRWYLALPKNLDSQPMEAAICVVPTAAGAGCDAPEHVAVSGVSVREWKGGNLPVDEEQMYQWSQSKSGFTVLGIGIILAVLTMGVMMAYGLAGGTIAGNTIGASQAAYYGYQVGSMYVTTNRFAGEGAMEIVSGLTNVRDGFQQPDLSQLGEHAQGLAAAVAPKMQAGVIGNTLTGAKKMAYGDCRNNPGAECAAADPGLAMRPRSYRRPNIPKNVMEARNMCTATGVQGRALERCMAQMHNLMMQQMQGQ